MLQFYRIFLYNDRMKFVLILWISDICIGVKEGKENSNKENKKSTPSSKKSANAGTRKRTSKIEEEDESSRPKKRRLVIPSDNSDDSGDEFKPGNYACYRLIEY